MTEQEILMELRRDLRKARAERDEAVTLLREQHDSVTAFLAHIDAEAGR